MDGMSIFMVTNAELISIELGTTLVIPILCRQVREQAIPDAALTEL